MLRTLTFVSIMALGAALVGGALAQTAKDSATMDMPAKHHGPKAGMRFDAMDTNKDGALDKSEAKGGLAKAFDEIDVNKDGKVTKDELKAGWQAHRADRQAKMLANKLARIDTDKDGKVSWAESEAQAKARFDKADANHDGFLDSSEMTARKGWRHHGKDMAPQQGR